MRSDSIAGHPTADTDQAGRSSSAGLRDLRCAVVRQKGGPLVLEDAKIGEPRAGEILVRMVASGICHTDVNMRDQVFTIPLPLVLGHEGSGIVEAVGAGCSSVEPGDHVVMSFLSCGQCRPCQDKAPAYCKDFITLNFSGARPDGSNAAIDKSGQPLHGQFFGQSSFATYAIANERNVVVVPKEAPLELLGPLGCGIQTGAGAVLNSLKVRAGSSFVAFGAGAVGMSAVMAARIAGAKTIIAVDVSPNRLALAQELGATHALDPRERDALAAIKDITGGGADYTLEATGWPAVLDQAIAALGIRGACGVAGVPGLGVMGSFNVMELLTAGLTIRGVAEGDSVPQTFIPALMALHAEGRFPFDRLVQFYPFEAINEAMHDSESGKTIKPILRIG